VSAYMSSTRVRVLCVAAAIAAAVAAGAAGRRVDARRRDPASTFPVDASTRLLVVAPHPDDEVLAAGGLIQRVRSVNGAVHIAYLTDGDGFPEGVRAKEGREDVKPSDFRAYGSTRKDEARDALSRLGIPRSSLTFLGFPDGRLSRLLTAYWSDRHPPYTSPYTRRDRPKKSEILDPGVKFRGEDLTEELAAVIGEFKPTLVLTPRKEDQHVDHCAAWFFTADAVSAVQRVDANARPALMTYVVHIDNWPFTKAEVPPMPGGPSGWARLPLTHEEVRTKLEAIREFKTQMKMMKSFLEGFARPTEVFAKPRTDRVALPLRRNPCDAFLQ
jgi:LmbE family N-acetylglucosaminyl deacetylase